MKAHTKGRSKGFTLIELLIVIGIVVILAVAAVLTLNPAELLRQARDSNRVNDMGTLKSAVALYLADASSPNLGISTNCYMSLPNTSGLGTFCGARFVAGTNTATTTTVITGTGWIPVNFSAIGAGSPIAAEPLDPVNTTGTNNYYYAYRSSSTLLTYELNANMESVKYSLNGPSDVEGTDGGSDTSIFELGIVPGLNL